MTETGKLRVLHLNANHKGGAFVAAQRLVEALNKSGVVESEHWVFQGNVDEAGYRTINDTKWKHRMGFFSHAYEKLKFLRYERDRGVRFKFSTAEAGIDITKLPGFDRFDIIHLHWINMGFLSFDSLEKLAKTGKKIVWTAHDMWPFTGGCYHSGHCDNYRRGCGNCKFLAKPDENDLSKILFYKKNLTMALMMPHFVTPSQWLRQRAMESLIVRENKCPVSCIPNPLDTELFSEAKNKVIAKKEVGMSGEKFVIGFVAVNTKDPWKGYSDFRNLLLQLDEEMAQQTEVLMIGAGSPEGNKIGSIRIKSTGFISEPRSMARLYRACDAFVTTSHFENLPTTIMEAMACGVPVFAYHVGGIPEMVEHRKNGFLAADGDFGELAQVISSMYKTGLEEWSKNARYSAVEKYSFKTVAQAYGKVYGIKIF